MKKWIVMTLFVLSVAGFAETRPNFLVVITDDQSFWHTSFAGDPIVKTPGFDRIAENGVYFENAFCSAPSCGPSRAAMLTGRNFYELENGSTLWATFPDGFPTFQDLLREAGYWSGYTGKAWGPSYWGAGGRETDPAGLCYNQHHTDLPEELSPHDYIRNFEQFMKERPKDMPFSFIYGSWEPHLPYVKGRGERNGRKPEDVQLLPFLADTPGIRRQMLEYYDEIEFMDSHLVQMLDYLEKSGELDNTLVLFTSDNGMPFPRAKSNLYDAGVREPFAAMWPNRIAAGRRVTDFISLADIAPTLLEIAGAKVPKQMTARSFRNVLLSKQSGRIDPSRDHVVVGMERHDDTAPMRGIRTDDHLLIHNYFHADKWRKTRKEEWPWNVAAPQGKARESALEFGNSYHAMAAFREDPAIRPFSLAAWGPRPEWELFEVKKDEFQMKNVADSPEQLEVIKKLKTQMESYLEKTNDPRMLGTENFAAIPDYRRAWVEQDPENHRELIRGWKRIEAKSNKKLKAYYRSQN